VTRSPPKSLPPLPLVPAAGGWVYTPAAIAAIVAHVREKSLGGYLNYLSDAELATKFPNPVVHWVGAELRGEVGYFRGVVDKTAGDVRRWLKAHRITQPSILTRPKLTTRGGTTYVASFTEVISLAR